MGQEQRGAVRPGHFPAHRAPRALEVIALKVEDSLVRLLAQPEPKWHGPLLQEIVDTPHQFDLRLLYDVGWVQASAHSWVKVQLDKGADRRPMPLQKRPQGLPIPFANLLQKSTG